MSLLKKNAEGMKERTGGGAPLPNNTYLCMVDEAQVEKHEKGSRLFYRVGSLRTEQGATEFELANGDNYRIGNRKVFARHWIDYSGGTSPEKDEKTTNIGNSEIQKLAYAAGLGDDEGEVEGDDWNVFASELVGKEFLIKTVLKPRKNFATGQNMIDDVTGKAIYEPNIQHWMPV